MSEILLDLEVAGLDELLTLPPFKGVDQQVIDSVLSEFGRFAGVVVAPTNREGDLVGSRLLDSGHVCTPPQIANVYSQFVGGGWCGVQSPPAYGGGGLPFSVGLALQEMMASANLALSLQPTLTQSAIELLLAWGSETQRSIYLPRLISGEWSGTMNLTEPDAGSDLGNIRSEADRVGADWHVSGTKIFITWGEHDLTDNIVHLVLARTPNAPAGTKGLSLFAVPKYRVRPDGSLGVRNTLRCVRVEEKLGIMPVRPASWSSMAPSESSSVRNAEAWQQCSR